jgi:hypothetical protein
VTETDEQVPPAPDGPERRSAPRRQFVVPLAGYTDQHEIARLLNISTHGMLVQLDGPVRIGDVREFTFDRGDVRLVVYATIVHTLGVTMGSTFSVVAGVSFRDPLTVEQHQVIERLAATPAETRLARTGPTDQ